MGGGFRSVPATGLLNARINPGQSRTLPVTSVSLSPPVLGMKVMWPEKGEPLQLGDASEMLGDSPLARAALIRLATDKAPITIAQLVMWHVRVGLDWPTISRLSKTWANPNEIALARHFVNRLAAARAGLQGGDPGGLNIEVASQDASTEKVAAEIRSTLTNQAVLGLAMVEGIPTKPVGPSLACRIRFVTAGDSTEAVVQVLTTDPTGREWVSAGKFTLPLARNDKGEIAADKLFDAVAEGTLSRLVRVQLTKEKGKDKKGKERFTIKIENASPLVLNGLAVSGISPEAMKEPAGVAGLSLAPHKNLVLPATAEVVERLRMKDGIRVMAADLSGL